MSTNKNEPAGVVNRRARKLWRNQAIRILTRRAQDMHSMLTDLLTISGQAQQSLTNNHERHRISQLVATIWDAARLGFAGADKLTLSAQNKSHAHLLQAAFRYGQAMHNQYRERFRTPEHLAAAGARPRPPQTLREQLQPPTIVHK